MRLSQVVRSGPGQYICEAGALKYLAEKLAVFRSPVIIAGEQALAAFHRYLPQPLEIPALIYDGTASHEDMRRLARQAHKADVIIGIGGGRALDTAKGTAELLNSEYITIPTVIGTCSAYTPLSAVYHPDHTFNVVDYYHRAAYLVLLDLTLLVHSPRDYFMGGIGDTIAKWYESEAITRSLPPDRRTLMVRMALDAAKETHEVLLNDTPAALEALAAGNVTPAFARVTEAVIAVAGMVGGCGGEYGRMAGAHAIHNGLSLIPSTHHVLHGIKVAYGILVQLVATGDKDVAQHLAAFYRQNGFPVNLAGVDAGQATIQQLTAVAEFAASPQETFRLAKPDIDAKQVIAAIQLVEEMATGGN